ncbi:transposase [Chryseobacterium sp. MEBOG06]|uniref:transposase n=1 Tax=Chryseobacterium sp. MEBOG06 TaxID=2879938 RepID=UPI001F367578|nr:transposase [Chryseobacterium sp. MEBOG06]UKB86302.1 transposase [Chryseobacterium sp. MEBOG06]
MESLKQIHIGTFIEKRVKETNISLSRLCNYFNCDGRQIENMYQCEFLDSHIILKWSKILNYDFFRLYTQHLILYSPQQSMGYNSTSLIEKSGLPEFRKNIYTKEIILFIMELLETNIKTKAQVIQEYNIPKTTLYKWFNKYRNLN